MKNSIELLRAEVEMKEQEIRKMQAQIADKEKQQEQIELDPDDYEDQFDDMLDESGTVEAGGYSFYPSRILKELDPVAYSCSLNDFVDSLYCSESEQYKELQEQIDSLEDTISDTERELDDLFSELEKLKKLNK